MMLNKEQILTARDKRTLEVEVPEFGEGATVLIGTMGALTFARLTDWVNGLGRADPPEDETDAPVSCDDVPDAGTDEPARRTYTNAENTEVMVRWCAACLLDPATHRPAFGEADVAALGDKSPAALSRIYRAILELHHETPEARDELEKNSGRTTADGSGGD